MAAVAYLDPNNIRLRINEVRDVQDFIFFVDNQVRFNHAVPCVDELNETPDDKLTELITKYSATEHSRPITLPQVREGIRIFLFFGKCLASEDLMQNMFGDRKLGYSDESVWKYFYDKFKGARNTAGVGVRFVQSMDWDNGPIAVDFFYTHHNS